MNVYVMCWFKLDLLIVFVIKYVLIMSYIIELVYVDEKICDGVVMFIIMSNIK